MEIKSDKISKKYELVPPDGGWGYMICLAFIINCSTVIMFVSCFGLLYNDFIEEIGMNSTSVTLLTGMNAIFFALSGFLTSSILKLMSIRKLCLLAATLHNLGALGIVFANSVPVFFLCQGCLMGFGYGMVYNLMCSIMNEYFVKRRIFAYSVVQFFVAIAVMVAPIFVKWSLQEYGFRGTVLLVAGIMMQNIFGVTLMQPVKMHMKRVEVLPTAEMQPLLVDGKSNVVVLTDKENAMEKAEGVKNIPETSGKTSAFRRFLEAFIDVSFAKKYILSCVCLGPAFALFADSLFSLILPQALFTMGWSQSEVAWALSIYGFGDFAMRTILIFTGSLILKIGVQEFYLGGILLACVSRLGMLWSKNQIAIYIYIALMGVARCGMFVLIVVVLAEVVPADRFTQAVGISMLMSGITANILGPAIGAILDLTNSYSTAFYLLTSFFAIIALFWSIELFYKKNKDKRRIQKENLEKIKSSRLNKGK